MMTLTRRITFIVFSFDLDFFTSERREPTNFNLSCKTKSKDLVDICSKRVQLLYLVTYSDIVTNVQLASTFAGETIDPKQYFNATTPVIITGATSGVKGCYRISRCNCNITTFVTFKIFKFWNR